MLQYLSCSASTSGAKKKAKGVTFRPSADHQRRFSEQGSALNIHIDRYQLRYTQEYNERQREQQRRAQTDRC